VCEQAWDNQGPWKASSVPTKSTGKPVNKCLEALITFSKDSGELSDLEEEG
jgi:hypothetical protein